MSGLTSPELIELFNEAAGLSRAGKYEEALAAWDRLLKPSEEEKKKDGPKRMMSGDFLGQSMMRKAWVLIDLERYEEAKAVHEDDVLKACLGQFSMEVLYEYFFSYGNTLGNLGDIDGMDDALSRALGIAAEEIGDLGRCARVWNNLMVYAERAEAWKYLEKESANAETFSNNTGVLPLQYEARWYRLLALRGLDRKDEAIEIGQALLETFKEAGNEVRADEVKVVLESLKK